MRMQIARDHGIDIPKIVRGSAKKTATAPQETLSKEDSWIKAQTRASAMPLPLKLSNGVIITKYGTPKYASASSLPMVGFTSRFTDVKGITFKSMIVDNGTAPHYTVQAKRKDDGDDTFVEVGAGSQPDAAWHAVAEHQQEAMETLTTDEERAHEDDGDAQEKHGTSNHTRDSVVHQLLKSAAQLSNVWGTERFGLSDIKCLQALEGQSGVKDTSYSFVDERYGWEEEAKLLAQEARRHGIPGSKQGVKRQRTDQRPKTKPERDAEIVHRVLDGIIRHIEGDDARHAASEKKAALKRERELQKMLEKEQKRLMKEREKELARQEHDRQRELQRIAAIEAAKIYPDEVLPSAGVTPPRPRSVGEGLLPASCEPVVVEAWYLAHRFSALLGVEESDVPTLQELEHGLVHGSPIADGADANTIPGVGNEGTQDASSKEQEKNNDGSGSLDAASSLMLAFTDFLISDLYQSAVELSMENNPDVKDADLRHAPRTAHPVPINARTWQEAARRYVALVAAGAAAWGTNSYTGLPYPLHALDAELVLQLLAAGAPVDLSGPMMLPKHAASHAAHAMVSRHDAESLKESLNSLNTADNSANNKRDMMIRVQGHILRELCNVHGEKGKHARLLCFQGQLAATAAKFGRPLDLRIVASRVDAGVYADREDPLAEFSADVNYVCALHQAAANKHASNFAAENAEKGIAEVAAMVMSKLESMLDEVQQCSRLEEYLLQHANDSHTHVEKNVDGHQHDDQQISMKTQESSDHRRPTCPFADACAVCWDDTDAERMFTCSKCEQLYHVYCINPPLVEYDTINEDVWVCSVCTSPSDAVLPFSNEEKKHPIEYAKCSQGAMYWHMAQLLSSEEYSDWSPVERAGLLSMLCDLVADSPALRDHLRDEEHEQKEMRKELIAKRTELKQRQQEEQGTGGGAIDKKEEPHPVSESHRQVGSRRARDAAAGIEALVQRISHLEHATEKFESQRLQAIGYDRHYNRYYVLPAAALQGSNISGPGAILVERYRQDESMFLMSHDDGTVATSPVVQKTSMTMPRCMDTTSTEWQIGIYPVEDFDDLRTWLNPKGQRERALNLELVKSVHLIKSNPLFYKRNANQIDDGLNRSGSATIVDTSTVPHNPANEIRIALLDFESGWMSGTRDTLRGSPSILETWRNKVSSASTPSELMRLTVALEAAVSPEWLKPHWRVWSMPAPNPMETKTYSEVWLRLEALKLAVRMRITLRLPMRDMAVAVGAKYALRQQQQTEQGDRLDRGKKRASSSNGDGSARSMRERDARAAKRARHHNMLAEGDHGMTTTDDESNDDEAFARKLDAELNAGRGAEGRSLRSRLQKSSRRNSRGDGGYGVALRARSSRRSYREDDEEESDEWEEDDNGEEEEDE